MLKALLDDQNSGAAALLAHAGVNVPQVKQKLAAHLNGLPKVSGQGGDIMPSRELQAVLNLMDKAAVKRGDAYIAPANYSCSRWCSKTTPPAKS